MPVALPCGNHIRASIIRFNPAIAPSNRATGSAVTYMASCALPIYPCDTWTHITSW